MMFDFQIAGSALFDRSVSPALLVQDGTVRYFNRAAAQIFLLAGSTLTEGCAVPEALADFPEGAGTRPLAGEDWQVECHAVPEGLFYLLSPTPGERGVMSSRRFREMSVQLRGALDAVGTALWRLENEMVETERLRQEEQIAALEKRFHQLLCLCWDLDILVQMEEQGAVEKLYPFCCLDIAGLCRDVWRQADYLVESAGSTLSFETDEGCGSVLVQGHDYLLTLLICHLVADTLASLYGTPGQIRIRVGKDRSKAFVTIDRLTDKDVKVPLSPEVLPDTLGAAGLGVPVCRQIVASHGGAIAVTNTEHSRRIVLSLPISSGKEASCEPIRSMEVDFTGGYSPALVTLSAQLPTRVFHKRELE